MEGLVISNIIMSILISFHLISEYFHYIHEFFTKRRDKKLLDHIHDDVEEIKQGQENNLLGRKRSKEV